MTTRKSSRQAKRAAKLTPERTESRPRPKHKAKPSPKHFSSVLPFPVKLHQVLEDAETQSFDQIISWAPCGSSFRVHDTDAFANNVMKRYFRQSKYKSFQRQLNLYGFTRIHHGDLKGSYVHRLFHRGQPEISHGMVREKIKGRPSIRTGGNADVSQEAKVAPASRETSQEVIQAKEAARSTEEESLSHSDQPESPASTRDIEPLDAFSGDNDNDDGDGELLFRDGDIVHFDDSHTFHFVDSSRYAEPEDVLPPVVSTPPSPTNSSFHSFHHQHLNRNRAVHPRFRVSHELYHQFQPSSTISLTPRSAYCRQRGPTPRTTPIPYLPLPPEPAHDSFLLRLHDLVTDQIGACWESDGLSFSIRNSDALLNPLYCDYGHFQEQLAMHGFRRDLSAGNHVYYHQHFTRDDRSKCKLMMLSPEMNGSGVAV